MAVSKKELLKMFDDALEIEELSIPIINKHLRTALFWSGLSKEETEELRTYLLVLAGESGKHSKFMNSMKKKVQESKKDVF